MSSKLNRFRRNLNNFAQQRENAKYARVAESFTFHSKSFNPDDLYGSIIMSPPNELIQWYNTAIQSWGVDFIASCLTYTKDQILYATQRFLQERYMHLQVSNAVVSNRATYWKPEATYCEDQQRFEIKLGDTLIATFS